MESKQVFVSLADGAVIDISKVTAFFDSRYVSDMTKFMKDKKLIDLCSESQKTTTKTIILTSDDLAVLIEAEVESVCQLMRKYWFIVSD